MERVRCSTNGILNKSEMQIFFLDEDSLWLLLPLIMRMVTGKRKNKENCSKPCAAACFGDRALNRSELRSFMSTFCREVGF